MRRVLDKEGVSNNIRIHPRKHQREERNHHLCARPQHLLVIVRPSRCYAGLVHFFTEADVLKRLAMADAIECLRSAFADLAEGKAQNQPRRRLTLPTGAILHSLAGAYGDYFGTKVYSTHPRYGAHFTFILYDANTARPLAQFEANHLGQIRTGAASGIAADYLAPRRALKVAVIGSGFQALTQLGAVASVREIAEARVWSRTREKRESFAHATSAVAAENVDEAVEGADVIITATNSKDPVLPDSAAQGGALVIAIGSNHAQRRELPSELVRRAGRIVVDDLDSARIEAGDLLLALRDEDWARVEQLKDVVAGKAKAGQEDRLTIFKSVGMGLEDVAVAAFLYKQSIPASESADPNPATR